MFFIGIWQAWAPRTYSNVLGHMSADPLKRPSIIFVWNKVIRQGLSIWESHEIFSWRCERNYRICKSSRRKSNSRIWYTRAFDIVERINERSSLWISYSRELGCWQLWDVIDKICHPRWQILELKKVSECVPKSNVNGIPTGSIDPTDENNYIVMNELVKGRSRMISYFKNSRTFDIRIE